MSAKITGQVWDLQLPRMEIMILLAMADHADHDGRNVFPSQALIAWKTGYSKRQVQRVQDSLKQRKILIPEGTGFRGVLRYRLDFSLVPLKAPFPTSDNMTIDKMSLVRKPYVNESLQTTRDKMSPVTSDNMTIDKMSTVDILDTTSDIFDTSHNNDARAEPSVEPLLQEKETTKENANAFSFPAPTDAGAHASTSKPPRKPRKPKERPSYDPEGYDRFIAAYPCHKNLLGAVAAWDARQPNASLQVAILADIEARKSGDRKWADGFIVYPGKYLRDQRWTDEIEPIRHASASPPRYGQRDTSPEAQERMRQKLQEIDDKDGGW